MSTQTPQRARQTEKARPQPRRAGRKSAELTETDRAIIDIVDRGGLHITEHELRYQLRRRSIDVVALLERMMDLEQRGLMESTLCFRLTQAGIESLPDGHERPLAAGYRSDWR